MSRRAVPLALLLSPALALAANGAGFTLRNQTGQQRDEVPVSARSSRNWGKDVMGKDTLDAGQSVEITLPRSNSACMSGIMVKQHDSNAKAERSNVDLYKYSAITLYSGKNGAIRAVGE